jgi:hypothetical protein
VTPPLPAGTPPVTARELWSYLPRVRPYLRPYRKLLGLVVGLTALTAAVALAEPWPLAMVVDSVLGDHKPLCWCSPSASRSGSRSWATGSPC